MAAYSQGYAKEFFCGVVLLATSARQYDMLYAAGLLQTLLKSHKEYSWP